MADIDLQKKRPRWGVWIIAALVAVLAIWALAEMFDTDAPLAGDPDVTDSPAVVEPAEPEASAAAELGTAGAGAGPAVAEFRQQCVETPAQTEDMGMQHQWTANCLERMADALNATIQEHANDLALDEHLTTLRQRAEEVRQADPSATTHAGTVASAFDAGAELIEAWHEAQGTAGDAAASVQQAADRLSGDQRLLDQRDAVHTFFREVSRVLPASGV